MTWKSGITSGRSVLWAAGGMKDPSSSHHLSKPLAHYTHSSLIALEVQAEHSL